MKKVLLLLAILTVIYFAGCTDDEIVKPPYYNTPAMSKTTDAFAYTLTAEYFTSTAGYDVTFTSDSLAYSLIISSYFSGIGNLDVKDSSGAILYSEILQGNKVISFTQTDLGIPKIIHIDFDHFTGSINFALAKSNSN